MAIEHIHQRLKIAFAALHGRVDVIDWQGDFCECDPDTGHVPCQYCALYSALDDYRNLIKEQEAKTPEVVADIRRRADSSRRICACGHPLHRAQCPKGCRCNCFTKKGEVMERPECLTDEHLGFLDELRESGYTNMFGARPILWAEFPALTKKEASQILSYWRESFGKEQR